MKKALWEKVKGWFIDDTPLTEQELKDIEELEELKKRIENDKELQKKLKEYDKWQKDHFTMCGL